MIPFIDMADNNCSVMKNDKLHPECPLEFVKFLVINKVDGSTSNILKLRGKEQKLAFKNARYLIGNNLTLIIPKYIQDNASHYYFVELPDVSTIKITDINDTPITPIIVTSETSNVYYLNIAITEEMFCYYDLNLIFISLNLILTPITKPKCSLPVTNQWRWIATVIDD